MRPVTLVAFVLVGCAAAPAGSVRSQRRSYPCHAGVCVADDTSDTEELRRRAIEGHALACRAGNSTTGVIFTAQCLECFARIQARCDGAGIADCHASDAHEPERSCF